MNKEDKSIPRVMHETTFWITFLYREASRCTSADCKLFFNSLISPFLFDSLKNVAELDDMLNRILNCRNIVHLINLDTYHYFNHPQLFKNNNDVNCLFRSKLLFLSGQNGKRKNIASSPARDTMCRPTWIDKLSRGVFQSSSITQAGLVVYKREKQKQNGSL